MPLPESGLPTDSKPISTELIEDSSYANDVQYIAARIKQRQCILFLGSAIHAPAPDGSKYDYPVSKCPPIGSQLSESLAKKCGYPDQDRWNLQRVSWFFERKNVFRSILVDEIKAAVQADRTPSPVLRGLAQMGFPIVITTNYDQLYERALDLAAQEQALPEQMTEKPRSIYDKSVYLISSKVRTRMRSGAFVQPACPVKNSR